VGYPDWYEGPQGGERPRGSVRARKPSRFAANVQGTNFVSGMDIPLEEAEASD